MTIEHLLYTPQDSHPPSTMVMLVDDDMLEKYQRGDDVDVSQVIDSRDVFKYENGKHGKLIHPSKSEIESAFGTTKINDEAIFMLKNGSVHGRSKGSTKRYEDASAKHSRMHVPHSGRPL
jgi:ribosome maturation protein Sdo1